MRAIYLLLLIAVATPFAAEAKSECEKIACASVKEKIRTIEARMRSGYTRAQGERFDAKLRELKEKRYRLCR